MCVYFDTHTVHILVDVLYTYVLVNVSLTGTVQQVGERRMGRGCMEPPLWFSIHMYVKHFDIYSFNGYSFQRCQLSSPPVQLNSLQDIVWPSSPPVCTITSNIKTSNAITYMYYSKLVDLDYDEILLHHGFFNLSQLRGGGGGWRVCRGGTHLAWGKLGRQLGANSKIRGKTRTVWTWLGWNLHNSLEAFC